MLSFILIMNLFKISKKLISIKSLIYYNFYKLKYLKKKALKY